MDQHELAFSAGGSFREAAGPPAGPWADPAGPGGSGRPQSVGTKIGSVAHVTCWVFCLFLRTGSSFLKSHPCVSSASAAAAAGGWKGGAVKGSGRLVS